MALYIGNKKVCPTIKITNEIGIKREIINGEYQVPYSSYSFVLPSTATDIDRYALFYAFYNSYGLTSVDCSSLIDVSGDRALQNAFYGCSNLTSANFSNLETISGDTAFTYTFHGTSITTMSFPNLSEIDASQIFFGAFDHSSIQSLSFPSLNNDSFGSYTNQFGNMLSGVTGCTVHFPSNLQSVIGSWSDVVAGFGGTNTTVLFDLTATT